MAPCARVVPLLLALALALSPLSASARGVSTGPNNSNNGKSIVNTCASASTCKGTPSVSPIPVGFTARSTAATADACITACRAVTGATYYEFNPAQSAGIPLVPAPFQPLLRTTGSCFCYASCQAYSVDLTQYGDLASTLKGLNTTVTAGTLLACP